MAMVEPLRLLQSELSLTMLGQPGDKIYRDTDDIETITSWDMPGNPHREVDDAVMTDGKVLNVPTAIIARAQLPLPRSTDIANTSQLQLYTVLVKARSRPGASRYRGLLKPFLSMAKLSLLAKERTCGTVGHKHKCLLASY